MSASLERRRGPLRVGIRRDDDDAVLERGQRDVFTPLLAFSADGSRVAAKPAHGVITIGDASPAAVSAFRELEPPTDIESTDPATWRRRAELALRSGRWDRIRSDGAPDGSGYARGPTQGVIIDD